MKYLRLLIIPLIMFMFVVPVNALDEVDNLPDWATSGDYYVVYHSSSGYTVTVLSRTDNFSSSGTPGVSGYIYAPREYVIGKYNLRPGSDTWRDEHINTFTVNGKQLNDIWFSNYTFEYSNFDIYVGDELVFPKTPVISLAVVQQKALANLGTEVQGASWKISAAGGLILGAILVTHLVNRLRHWVTV